MQDNLQRRPIGEEVARFVTESDRYYAVTVSGRRVNIVRSKTYQPPISHEDDFKTYLWVEALEGFFLLSQRFQNGKPGQWILEEEILPVSQEKFFADFFSELTDGLM